MKLINYMKKHPILMLFITTIIIYFILFLPYGIMGHDSLFHVANSMTLKEYIDKHLFINPIANVIANNFGYGIRIFYPSLAHVSIGYIASFLGLFKISLITAMNLFNFIILFLSGLFMYKLVKYLYKSDKVAFLGALIYITFPYHLSEIFVRSSLSENLTFVFLPLILLGFLHLIDGNYNKFYLYFIPGVVLMVYSHLVMTVYCALFFIIYIIFNYKKVFKKNNIIALLKASLLICLFISPFIVLMLQNKFGGDYVVFSNNAMTTIDGILANRIDLYNIFFKPFKNDIDFSVNIVVLITFIYIIIKNRGLYKKIDKRVFVPTVIMILVSLFLFTKLAPWQIFPHFLTFIQFPWRLNTFFLFGITIITPVIALKLKNKSYAITCILIVLTTLITTNYRHVRSITYLESYQTTYQEISKNGMGLQNEYLPVKTSQNMDYFENRSNEVIVINGEGVISNVMDDTPDITFNISNNLISKIELPRLYYVGYSIYMNGKKVPYYENDKGFIEIDIEGNGTVTCEYTGTDLYRILIAIDIILLISIGLVYLKKSSEPKKSIKK